MKFLRLARSASAPWLRDTLQRASTLAHAGRSQDGIAAVEEALTFVDGPPNVLAPQFPVLRGDLLASLGDHEHAAESYRAAIELAQGSGARMNELQATIGLVRLGEGAERVDAIERLRGVYAGFTEGFDAPDVAEARELLDRPGSPASRERPKGTSTSPVMRPSGTTSRSWKGRS